MAPFSGTGAFVIANPMFIPVAPAKRIFSSSSPWCRARPFPRHFAPRAEIRSFSLYQPRCEASAAAAAEDEDTLDEAAMRAAEIHEVLDGLADFKARIVAGTSSGR
jgi:hypothetical protein